MDRRLTSVSAVLLALLAGASIASAAAAPSGDPLMGLYEAVQQRLVADQPAPAVHAARELAAAARELPKGAPGEAEAAAVATAAAKLDGESLTALRGAFGELSQAMATYTNAAGLDVNLFYCPMKQSYWVQPKAKDTPQNPYFGQVMPSCGVKKDKVG